MSESGEGAEQSPYKRAQGNLEVIDTCTILIVLVVSHMCTYVKTYHIVHFMCGLLYVNYTTMELFKKKVSRN